MKRNYIKPKIEIIEAEPAVFICESLGQIGEGDAKANGFFDYEEDWSDFEDDDFQKSIFEEEY